MLYSRTIGFPLLGYQISGSWFLYLCHCIIYVFAHDFPLLFQRCSSIFSNVFFQILGKIEYLMNKWMFLIPKDIQFIINSGFRRIIVFLFKIAVMAPWWKSKALSREKQRKATWTRSSKKEIRKSWDESNKARLLKEQLY